MFEYFVNFLGQLNLNTTYLGELSSDPLSTGRTSDYFYHTTENVWKVDSSSGWRSVADPSALIGAIIITDTSDVAGSFEDSNNGVRYLMRGDPQPYAGSSTRWVQFYARTETRLSVSSGVWPQGVIAGGITSSQETRNRAFVASITGTTNTARGSITSPGWIQLNFALSAQQTSQVPDVYEGSPQFAFVFSEVADGSFFFIYNGGERSEARTHHLSTREIDDLYSGGRLYLSPGPYLRNLGNTAENFPVYINAPEGAQHIYVVGADWKNIYHVSGPQEASLSYGVSTVSYGELVYQVSVDITGEEGDLTSEELRMLCQGFVYRAENFERCEFIPIDPVTPPDRSSDSDSSSSVAICPTEFNAEVYKLRKRLTFYPLEIL